MLESNLTHFNSVIKCKTATPPSGLFLNCLEKMKNFDSENDFSLSFLSDIGEFDLLGF